MKINAKGQITIPKDILDKYGLEPGTEVEFLERVDGVSIMRKSDVHPVDRLRGTIKLQHADSVDEYIEIIRGR
jgi:AbrB family looped-hinge helix DNA binding protein